MLIGKFEFKYQKNPLKYKTEFVAVLGFRRLTTLFGLPSTPDL
jgi:hypothetical protein